MYCHFVESHLEIGKVGSKQNFFESHLMIEKVQKKQKKGLTTWSTYNYTINTDLVIGAAC